MPLSRRRRGERVGKRQRRKQRSNADSSGGDGVEEEKRAVQTKVEEVNALCVSGQGVRWVGRPAQSVITYIKVYVFSFLTQ